MKLGEIRKSKESLDILVGLKGIKLVASFRLGALMSEIEKVLENYEKVKLSKIKELGSEEKDAEGNLTGRIQVKPENYGVFGDVMTELEEEEITLTIPEIKLSDFEEVSPTPEPKLFSAATWLIKE